MILYTVGYGYWPPARRMAGLIGVLKEAGARLLVDTRHSPCASQIDPAGHYGPRDWNLQAGGAGIAPLLAAQGIAHRWLVELGNPQKNDPKMAVLREHFASADMCWPVNRGMVILREILAAGEPLALLCACADWRKCHRTAIAEAARERFRELALRVSHLPGG